MRQFYFFYEFTVAGSVVSKDNLELAVFQIRRAITLYAISRRISTSQR